jgi:hypothetical protein
MDLEIIHDKRKAAQKLGASEDDDRGGTNERLHTFEYFS